MQRILLNVGVALAALFAICCVAPPCFAARIVLLQARAESTENRKEIELAARFYGVRLEVVEVGTQDDARVALSQLQEGGTVGAVITAAALRELEPDLVRRALRRPGKYSAPLLILGIRGDTDPKRLEDWTGGAVRGCQEPARGFQAGTVQVGDIPEIAAPLEGQQFPAVSSPACGFQLDQSRNVQTVLAEQGNGQSFAVLVRASANGNEVFLVPELTAFDSSWVGKPLGEAKAFSSLAPFLIFVRHASGNYGWHMDGHYANFTIDDAWLRDSYGHLNYQDLLSEMQKHNFHTTIAFIPWNFDRSHADVVAMFRAHADRYSISIHGNNHTHREFGGYATVPLVEQVADLKQAIARMERFSTLTGIPYDRVMVFPHAVAPEATFAALKKYDYLATANSQDVPLHSPYPADPLFLLRPFTLEFADFLSMWRQEAVGSVPRADIAINGFLGNPLLFYAHEDVFDNGIGVFDEVADYVNQELPNTKWTNLGEISRRTYLLRLRDDQDFDVRMFSNEMTLLNPTQSDATFYVEREETFAPDVKSLTVNGVSYPYDRTGNSLTFRVRVPAGQSAAVRIRYQNDLDLARTDISKSNFQAAALRRISDFRDIYFSRFSLGRGMTRFYYEHKLDSVELRMEKLWPLILLLLALLVFGPSYFRRRSKRRSAESHHAG